MSEKTSQFRMLVVMAMCYFLVLTISEGCYAGVYYVGRNDNPHNPGKITDQIHILIRGKITSDDVNKLKEAIEKARKETNWETMGGTVMPLVILDSPGGEVLAAIEMGRILRSNNAQTWVLAECNCDSACVFLLAGGVERVVSPGASLGLHRPSFGNEFFAGLTLEKARDMYEKLIDRCNSYFAEMGISQRLLEKMLKIPSGEIIYINSSEAAAFGLYGKDPAFDEWDSAREKSRTDK